MRFWRSALLLVLFCTLAGVRPAGAQQRIGISLPPYPLRLAGLDAIDVFTPRPFATLIQPVSLFPTGIFQAGPRRLLHERWLAGPAPLGLEADVVDAAAVAAVLAAAGTIPDSTLFLPAIAAPPVRAINPLAGAFGQYADLFLNMGATGTMGGAWQRQRPCDLSFRINCNPGLMPQLKPDVQFNMEIAGTISERVHIDVNYDQLREFDAANNINVYYQGLPDEILQRIDVGDVSINLPSSRFMSRSIPAGNFGMRLAGQVGPAQFQTVFAQQKGDVTSREFQFGGGKSGVEQDQSVSVDDADYVKGQFFFLLPPDQLRDFPHVDALQLRFTDAPARLRPAAGGSIEVYRDERINSQVNSNGQLGYFLADAVPFGSSIRHTGSFRRLQPDQDYIVHASGLWIMLRSPLRPDEALAVSYLTETGDTVGTLRAESSPPGVTPRLRLLRGPFATHQPGSATWNLEMHQVYRLDSSSDVELNTIDLRISLGDLSGGRTFRDVSGQQLTFLKFFGLDEDSPVDRIDGAQVFRPARDAFSSAATTPIGGTYVIFPTLRPFAAPAPVPSARLTAQDVLFALGTDGNIDIYENPDPVTRESLGRFRLNFDYRGRVEGVVSSFNLGGFGLRENSETLTLGGRKLVKGIDYEIDYEIGMVTLLDANTLFATSPDAEIRATFEQKAQFSIAPTSIAGSNLRFDLGTRGEINLVGLFQSEKSLINRPQLGVEAGSSFLGGISGRFQLGGAMLDRVLNNTLGLRSTVASSVSLTGELALSQPNPNKIGVSYLDDFESTDVNQLQLRRQFWRLGSAAQSTQSDKGKLPVVLDASTAASLTWQHDYLQNGVQAGALPPSSIDQQINVIGTQNLENVMWLTFNGEPRPPRQSTTDPKRWRSITTVLSTTGLDMSRTEYLEFYVQAGETGGPLALIFDIGTVSEDAFYVDSLGATRGRFGDGREWGLGVLDEEARLIDREVWGPESDRRGLWNQSCLGERNTTFPLTDPRVNCTRNNGLNDNEDLNGNGVGDFDDGQYFRYVVTLDEISEYLVRPTSQTRTGFRLYRIPLRTGASVNGANDGTWRFIRYMRMTVAGEPRDPRQLAIARMNLVGSRWTKRDVHGVQRGMLDAAPGFGALTTEVTVGPVSNVTDGNKYYPPPGIVEELQDPSQQFGGGSEVNEKSLRLTYDRLEPGDRAEVFYRYPQQSRDMLMYGEMRLWVLPRTGSWGPNGGERFTVRIGSDPRNFYLYQSRLRASTDTINARPEHWLPEIVIDVQQWLELRTEAERRVIARGGSQTTRADTVWSADSTYAIVLQDRARAPNLAAVRELIFSVYNAGTSTTSGEVWIDDWRVTRPNRDAGGAGNLTLNVVAGDLINANVTLTRQGPMYRQLNDNPTYQQGTDLSFSADAHLDKLLPTKWGIDLPLSVSHTSSGQRPHYLQQTDVLADRLDGLRETGAGGTRFGLRVSKTTPTANPWLSLLLDGSVLRLSYTDAENRSVLTRSELNGFNGDYFYRRDLVKRDFSVMPGFIAGLLRAVAPDAVEKSQSFTRLLGSRLRWSPASMSLGTAYSDQLARTYRFDRILALPTDTAIAPIESPVEGLRNDVQVGLQPFTPLTLSMSMSSARDLLESERASTQDIERAALERARSRLGGMDIGWEANRAIITTMNFRPEITRWLDVGYTFDNRYLTDRSPAFLESGDSLAEMQRRFESTRSISRTVQLRPKDFVRPTTTGPDTASGIVNKVMRRFDLIDLTWRNSLASQFERESFTPAASYQIGLGDFNSFSAIGADTAVRAQQRHDFTANTNITLINQLSLTTGYRQDESESFDPRGGNRLLRTVEWPRARIFMRDLTLPEGMHRYLTTIGGSFGLERVRRSTEYAGNATQSRGTTELKFPFQFNLGLPKSFRFTYNGSVSSGETLDPTGNAESAGHTHQLTLNGALPAPERWSKKLTAPLLLSLSYIDTKQNLCRFNQLLAAADGCIAYVDLGSRNARIQVSSQITDISFGVSMDYLDRGSRIGQRNGSSQFQLNFFGQFNFTAGVRPGTDGAPR